MSSEIHLNARYMSLLPATPIAAAVTAVTTTPIEGLAGMKYLTVLAKFLYGAGGTTTKAWIQTSVDNGATWIDVMNFAFTTSALNKVSAVVFSTALAAGATPTDGTLADNTILSGLLGDRIRVKYTTTGTYTGATSLELDAIAKG